VGTKGNTTTSATTSTPNSQALSAYSNVLNQAQSVAATPYQAFTGQLVAPINAQQTEGISGINQFADAAQPAIGQAEGLVQSAANPLTTSQINQYMSPYTQDVVNATQAQFNNQNQQQQQQVTGNAIAQGALGGNRTAVAQSELANQQQLAQAPVIAGLENTGYQTGLSTAENQFQQNPMTAGMNLGNLGVAGQTAGLSGASAQLGAGTTEQQTQQAQDTAALQQFEQQQAYPFQTTNFLAGIDTGVGSEMGGSTTGTTTAQVNELAQILGGVTSGAGLLGATGAYGSSGWLSSAGLKRGGVADLEDFIHRAVGGAVIRAYAGGGVANYIPSYATGGSPSAPPGLPWAMGPTYVPNVPIKSGPGAPKASAPSVSNNANPLASQASQVGSLAKSIQQGLNGPGTGGAAYQNSTGGFNGMSDSQQDAAQDAGLLGNARGGVVSFARGGVAGFDDGGVPTADDDPVSEDDRAKGIDLLKQGFGVQQTPDDNRSIGLDKLRKGDGIVAPDSIPGGEPAPKGVKPNDDRDAPLWDDGNGPQRLDPDADERWRRGNTIAPLGKPQPPKNHDDFQLTPTEVAEGNNGISFPPEITTGKSHGVAATSSPSVMAYSDDAPPKGIAPPPAKVAEQMAEHPNSFDWGASNKLWPALITAGAGMLASRASNFGNALGEGLQAGANTYSAENKQEQEARDNAAKLELERERIERPYSEMTASEKATQDREAAQQKAAQANQAVVIGPDGKPRVNQTYVEAAQATQKDMQPKVLTDTNPMTGEVTHSVYDPNTKKFTVYNSQGQAISPPADSPAAASAAASKVAPDIDPVKTVEQTGMTGLSKAQAAAPYNYSVHAPTIEKGMDVPEPDLSYIPRQSAASLKADAAKYLQTGQLPSAPASRNSPLAVMATNYRAAVQNYGNAIAQSRGLNPDQLAAMWRVAPDLPKFIIGTPGQATVSLGVAVSHLDTLKQFIDAAQFPDTPRFKQLQAAISREFGSSAATNVDAAASVVGPEIVKAIGIAGAGTAEEREKTSKMFMGGARQATDAIKVVQHLMAGQLDGKQRQAEAVGMPEEMFKSLIGNRAYDLLKGLDKTNGAALAPQDKQALDWANANPNDPRASAIKKKLGIQ
jgi:hypothetical protein